MSNLPKQVTSPITIQLAEWKDSYSIVQLYGHHPLFQDFDQPKYNRPKRFEAGQILKALWKGELVGFSYSWNTYEPELARIIRFLFVAPEFRRRGVGRALVREVWRQAELDLGTETCLEVRVRAAGLEVGNWLNALGFKPEEQISDGSGFAWRLRNPSNLGM